MSGRPVLQKLEQHIRDMGGDEWLLDRIASGETPRAIAESITLPGHGAISRPLLYQWRNAGGTERREAWRDAMRMRGEGLVEEAGEILDALADNLPTAPEVSLAKERANHRRWLGGKLNEDFSDKPGDVNVAIISSDDAFALALRRHGMRRALPKPTPAEEEIPVADFEMEETDGED